MLIRYKKSFQKIAMGLLSFMPEVTDVKMLQQLINEYDESPDWQLFLWKDEDILGAVGVKYEGDQAVVQHISVNPSHRNMGIGKKMIHSLHDQFCKDYQIKSTDATKSFITKCESENSSSQV